MKHIHEYRKGRGSVDICSCGRFRHNEKAGPHIVEQTAAKHTPGPCGNLKHCVVPRDTETLSIYTDKEYCVPVNVAAAAPEMLEALRLGLRALQITGYESRLHAEALKAVSAAIAKAEGSQS